MAVSPSVKRLLSHVGCNDDKRLDCKKCAAIRAIVRRYAELSEGDLEVICNGF